MQSLDASDVGRVARFLAEVGEIDGDEAFPPEFLAALRRLVPCDGLSLCEQNGTRQRELGHVEDAEEPEVRYRGAGDEAPLWNYDEVSGNFRALAGSHLITARELHRSRISNAWRRPWGVEHELTVGLDSPLSPGNVFLFDRGAGPEFSEHDRAVLDAIRPHLAARYDAAHARRQLRGVLELLEQADAAVVLVDRDDRIAFATDAARALLAECFNEGGERVPTAIASWRRARSAEPLTVECRGGFVEVRAAADALLLEGRPRAPRLTPREEEILELVADGLTNGEIAERLCVSPGTVRRHLENVYGKLGVHTRTAAAAFVRRRRRA